MRIYTLNPLWESQYRTKRTVALIRERTDIYFTVHDLRRTFASIAGKIVARDYVIKRLLNHKPVKTDVTAHNYINLSVDDIRDPMDKIGSYILSVAAPSKLKVVKLRG